MNRIERLSAILVKLQSRPLVTAREIAEQFGVSLRTVYRDIRSLEEAGIPVSGESGMGYSLVDGFRLPPLMFTTEEAISFMMAEKLIGPITDGDTFDAFRSGMDKIRAMLKAAEKDFLHTLDEYIRVPKVPNMPPAVRGDVMQPLIKSLLHKTQVEIRYRSYDGDVTDRTLEPQGIFFLGNYWYILAWCTLRSDYRTFHLGRILNINLTEKRFANRHPPLEELVQSIYYGQPETDVAIRVSPLGRKMTGTSRYTRGFVDELPDGEAFIQRYLTCSLEAFARWYMSFADQAEIIEPPELKKIVSRIKRSITL